MKRQRLSTSPIGNVLSFSKYINMVFEEPLILHKCAQANQYLHWIEHLEYLQRTRSLTSPSYNIRDKFLEIRDLISIGLDKEGFIKQSLEISSCSNEEELNFKIIKQYTDETQLYYDVNKSLRECHIFQDQEFDEKVTASYSYLLAPWILQLNVAIRRQKPFEEKVYRGTDLTKNDIKLYKEKELFVWAPFVSASKNENACQDGNVLFEIFTESAISLNDKRFPRDISHISIFPEEEEVLFPVACAYRVHYIKKRDNKTIIGVATVDHN